MEGMDKQQEEQRRHQEPMLKEPGFVHRVLVIYGLGLVVLAVILLFWYAAQVLLLVFASSLLAILLYHASSHVKGWLHISQNHALSVVLIAIAALFTLVGFWLGPRLVDQFNELANALPDSIERVRSDLEQYPWLQNIMAHVPEPRQLITGASSMMTQVTTVFGGVIGALTNLLIVTFVSLYLAARPEVYINGILTLVPIRKRPRAREVMDELGAALSQWLLGKMFSMLVVGIVTGVGLWLIGVPLAITLGIIAGLFDFIPYIGPILAGLPAVLIAFTADPILAFYVILLFSGIQLLEGYLLLPLVERRTVSLPPALNISAQVMLGLAFGLLGVALAAPLVATVSVLVIMLYVQDILGDNVQTPAEGKNESAEREEK
jgi:predicted PurR-regulated permease PerM